MCSPASQPFRRTAGPRRGSGSKGLLASLDKGQDDPADRLRQVRPGRQPAGQVGVHGGRFAQPDEVRHFEKGKFEVVRIGGLTLGRATYEPGWKWSLHVGPVTGTRSCQVEHVGLVLSGQAMVKMDEGREYQLGPGDLFSIAPGHDSWVVGDEPYVSLHFLGAEQYAH